MSIVKSEVKPLWYDLVCDICGDIVDTRPTWEECRKSKIDRGIKSRIIDGGEWVDICTDCMFSGK
jgi:hypothetical protein